MTASDVPEGRSHSHRPQCSSRGHGRRSVLAATAAAIILTLGGCRGPHLDAAVEIQGSLTNIVHYYIDGSGNRVLHGMSITTYGEWRRRETVYRDGVIISTRDVFTFR
jgi:hypothetical protein